MTAGLSGGQVSDAAVVYTPTDAIVPPSDYRVDINGDGVFEFDIQQFASVTKVADFVHNDPPLPTSMAAVVTDPNDLRTANLALGTLIGPASTFGPDGGTPPGGDPLNGLIDEDNDELTPDTPAGHFQVSDGAGYIGVKFFIGENTHYGYVGYEGLGNENDPFGHVFALGYDDTPDTAIAAGAGITFLTADFDGNTDVDARDFLIWQRSFGLAGTATKADGDADGDANVDGEDLAVWTNQFGTAPPSRPRVASRNRRRWRYLQPAPPDLVCIAAAVLPRLNRNAAKMHQIVSPIVSAKKLNSCRVSCLVESTGGD